MDITGRQLRAMQLQASPKPMIVSGERKLAHVPEDRHRMGLVIPFAGREGAILGRMTLHAFKKFKAQY